MLSRVRQLLSWRREGAYERVAESELAHARSRAGASCALLSVQGMTCSACSSAVTAALKAVTGVSRAEVSLLQHSAEVTFQGALVTADELVAAVEDCGFDCRLQSVHNVDDGSDGGGGAGKPQVARLAVLGMTCGACSGAVERGLLALGGVQHAAVSLTQAEAEVTFLPGVITPEALVAAVEELGFDGRLLGTAGQEAACLAVTGMTCGACSAAVERALQALPGVTGAEVNALTGRAQVWFNPTSTGPRALLGAVADAGFEASLLDDGAATSRGAAEHAEELARWRELLSMALVFTVPVFLLAMVLPMLPGTEAVLSAPVLGFRADELLKWALATPVQFWIGWRFHVGAWKALKRGVANMDVLVALGTDASYFYSVISILHHRFVQHDAMHYTPTDFFETCAMLITVVILGKYLECAAKGRTSEAIQALMALAPEVATLVELDEAGHVMSEAVISSRLVHHGDLLKVLPGGRIPADGLLVVGSSCINEAMITGESQPVLKAKGDALIGGTINTGNALIMQATRVGADTVLSQIVRLVERAQLSKAPIQAYADYIASLFVPVVVGLALLTWLAWFVAGSLHAFPDSWLPMGHTHFLFALLFGIAVLVIACPCALGLATPTAVMVGTGVGAQLGILIKGGAALERGSAVNTVIFDKTGTLTLGRPQVMQAAVFDRGYSLAHVCELAAAAEASSEHPLARAVLEFAEARLAAAELDGSGGAKAAAGHSTTTWSLDNTSTNGGSSSGNGSAAPSSTAMHGPSTPPHPGAFKAAFSLDDDHHHDHSSSTSSPFHQHNQQHHQLAGAAGHSSSSSPRARRRHEPSSEGGIQLVEISLADHPAEDGGLGSRHSLAGRRWSSSHGLQHLQQHQQHHYGGGWAHGDAPSRMSRPGSSSQPGSPYAPQHVHHLLPHQQQQHAAAPLGPAALSCSDGGASRLGLRRSRCSSSAGGGMLSPGGSSTPRAVRHLLASGLLCVSEVENHPGKGVTTVLPVVAAGGGANSSNSSSSSGLRLAIGNRLLMAEQQVSLCPAAQAFMSKHEAQARTCVLVGISGRVVAALAIADPLKPEARGVVAALHSQGVQVHLLTGDNQATAQAVAQQLAIPSCSVSAEVLPAGKAGVVGELQAAGRVVAMVGDGINDSPALAAADVGMAIGSGTDIAVEAADYVLMRDSLEQVLVALDLSRQTFRRIQWNFLWAMIYNIVMIPIAAGVLYPAWRWRMPPWVAGGCMVFSSVSVVLSSLLLRRYRPPAALMPRALAAVRVQS